MIVKSSSFIESPIVSVIIVTFNQEDTISKTIQSVIDQKFNFPYEIIIGEDASNDNTRQICIEYQQRFPEKIKLLLSEQNGGVVKNYINCVLESKGKYLTACAGDDFWHNPEKLQLQVDYMEKHPDCGVLHSDFDELNTLSGNVIASYRSQKNHKVVEGYCQKEIFNGKLQITAPTICFRKELIEKYVDLDKFIELDFPVEDWPLLIILSKYSKVNYLPISTVTYRKGQESLSNLKSYAKIVSKYKREKIMYKYLCDLFPEDLQYNENDYDIYVYGILLNLAYTKMDYKSARLYAKLMISKGNSGVKVKSALNRVSFYAFGILKKIKSEQFNVTGY